MLRHDLILTVEQVVSAFHGGNLTVLRRVEGREVSLELLRPLVDRKGLLGLLTAAGEPAENALLQLLLLESLVGNHSCSDYILLYS